MSAKKSPPTEKSAVEALIYEDVSLIGKYSVMEIAVLAAGCRGDTRAERISEAVELLAMVERYARTGSKTRLHIRYQKKGEISSDAEKSVGIYTLMQNRFLKASAICHAAKRDKKTAKIELTSLVGLAYNATTGGKEDSSEALRRYNEWAKHEANRKSISAEVFKAEFVSGANRSDASFVKIGLKQSATHEKPNSPPSANRHGRNGLPETRLRSLRESTRQRRNDSAGPIPAIRSSTEPHGTRSKITNSPKNGLG